MMSSKKAVDRPLVSVIVPAYNVESYISTCVESVVGQTYKHIEIILIDDGSVDSTGSILDGFSVEDERIKVIHQKNSGVSSARNRGLDEAMGDFVMFIDSDDWIDRDMVEKMVDTSLSEKADIVSCGMRYVNMAGKIRENFYGAHPTGTRLDSRESFSEIVKELIYGGGSLCCRLISRELTYAYRFIEGMRISEDQEWLLRVIQNVDCMVYLQEPLYNVRVRQGSATTKSLPSDVADIEVVNREIISWAQENGMVDSNVIANALFVRTRLQYSSAVRASLKRGQLESLRGKMIDAYAKTEHIHITEKIKYIIVLLPPEMYLLTRKWIKRIRRETK